MNGFSLGVDFTRQALRRSELCFIDSCCSGGVRYGRWFDFGIEVMEGCTRNCIDLAWNIYGHKAMELHNLDSYEFFASFQRMWADYLVMKC